MWVDGIFESFFYFKRDLSLKRIHRKVSGISSENLIFHNYFLAEKVFHENSRDLRLAERISGGGPASVWLEQICIRGTADMREYNGYCITILGDLLIRVLQRQTLSDRKEEKTKIFLLFEY